jgi:7-carboxy-7-deazaguanine synthase
MKIAEVYASLQGEGLLAGTPSTFVRTSGCNLRCVWCDTPFTSWKPEGRELTGAEVRAAVEALAPRHVVLTGGEPLLFDDVAPLASGLRRDGFHVTVETAGTVLPAADGPLFDLVSISPKLASSAPPPIRKLVRRTTTLPRPASTRGRAPRWSASLPPSCRSAAGAASATSRSRRRCAAGGTAAALRWTSSS